MRLGKKGFAGGARSAKGRRDQSVYGKDLGIKVAGRGWAGLLSRFGLAWFRQPKGAGAFIANHASRP